MNLLMSDDYDDEFVGKIFKTKAQRSESTMLQPVMR
jgi:hypothetical protein